MKDEQALFDELKLIVSAHIGKTISFELIEEITGEVVGLFGVDMPDEINHESLIAKKVSSLERELENERSAVICIRCKGVGETDANETCTACHGKGKIYPTF